MLRDNRKVGIFMKKINLMPDGQSGNQTVNRTSDRQSSFSQCPVNVRRVQVVSEAVVDFRKQQEVIENRSVLGIVSHSLENFLRDDAGDENRLAALKTFLQKKIFPRGSPAKKLDPH
jgi:hypothetical protein